MRCATVAGKLEHYLEIRDNFRIAAARRDLNQIPERLKKYERYREIEKKDHCEVVNWHFNTVVNLRC